jgi:hypothetical protein
MILGGVKVEVIGMNTNLGDVKGKRDDKERHTCDMVSWQRASAVEKSAVCRGNGAPKKEKKG